MVRDSRQSKNFQLSVDLHKDFEQIQRQKINPKKDLLCRSVGYKGEPDFTVFDGTLGMAKDALHLLSCGAKVVGVERNPVIHFLLQQSLEKGRDFLAGLQIVAGESLEILQQWAPQVDVVYLDPMFENLKQKSAPKKGLAFLREISGTEGGVSEIVEKAIKLGVKRVVVKRPLKSENLYGKPNIVYEGKLIRYDVYTRL